MSHPLTQLQLIPRTHLLHTQVHWLLFDPNPYTMIIALGEGKLECVVQDVIEHGWMG